ncbi:MAG: hypothetical protein ACQET7_04455 [Thermodesulfobacteriota bacterium]
MQQHTGQNLEGDVVLIYYQDEPTVYARIEAIEPDVKKDWYRLTLLMLTIPSQSATWILREEYINGTPFTMGGRPLRIEGVGRAVRQAEPGGKDEAGMDDGPKNSASKVIPLRKKNS